MLVGAGLKVAIFGGSFVCCFLSGTGSLQLEGLFWT